MAEPAIEKYEYKNQSSDTIETEQTLLHVMQQKTKLQEQKKTTCLFSLKVRKEDEYTLYTDVATLIEIVC